MSHLFDLATNPSSARVTATSTSSVTKTAEPTPALADDNSRQEGQSDTAPQQIQRDPGVSDEIWIKHQADIRANELTEEKSRNAIADLEQQVESAVRDEEASGQEARALAEATRANPSAGDDEEMNEQKRRHEEARLRDLMACRARQEAEEKLRKDREE